MGIETAFERVPAGRWPAAERRDQVVLDFDGRHRRRIRMVGTGGLEFLLDLPEAMVLRDGDGLRLEGGGFVEVAAAIEPLVEIRAHQPRQLARIAWHLGNRHLPTAIDDGCLRIREDPVIVAMVRGLGAEVRPVQAAFDPEGGAYQTSAEAQTGPGPDPGRDAGGGGHRHHHHNHHHHHFSDPSDHCHGHEHGQP